MVLMRQNADQHIVCVTAIYTRTLKDSSVKDVFDPIFREEGQRLLTK